MDYTSLRTSIANAFRYWLLSQTHPRKQPALAHPLLLQQPYLQLNQTRIRQRPANDRMPPMVRLAPFIDADELSATFIRQPHLFAGDCKILVCDPLPAIDRSNDWKINQRYAKQFQQIERERRRLRTRLMIE